MAFYPNGSAAPSPLPTYLVETPSGVWTASSDAECLDLVAQLKANGVAARALRVQP
jgi:hypothetical protein